MSCCVPGCNTSYWKKETKNISLYEPRTDRQMRDWSEILLKKVGLEKLNKTYKICILHFKEDVIERERNVFKRGGKVFKEKRKRPILSEFADPSIFSEKSKFSKKRKNDYCIKLDPEVFNRQRVINVALENNENCEKHSKMQLKEQSHNDRDNVKNHTIKSKVGIKRKMEIINDIDTEDIKRPKLIESNNFYEDVVNAIDKKDKISEYLNKLWIANINNSYCVSWSFWKEDYSVCLKRIVLHNDLKVDVYINEKPISLPEMNNIKGMLEFENLLKTVTEILPCMKVEDKTW
ncbi:uncharacterized protein LOC127285899 [Leptopilina boulardi]|uniref:uncharacterized protein LOC127285899 n=1 Tax=Leptopilina boulardi TaxID=63433 RepID=UPI0021F510C6|nr:uncharacterized protein LOC127285899 [Leptopilina boulardi]